MKDTLQKLSPAIGKNASDVGNIHKEITIDNRIFLKGLKLDTKEEDLQNIFCTYGAIVETKIIRDNMNGQSKGFGFITFDSQQVAQEVLSKVQSIQLDDTEITVGPAKMRRLPPNTKAVRNYNRYTPGPIAHQPGSFMPSPTVGPGAQYYSMPYLISPEGFFTWFPNMPPYHQKMPYHHDPNLPPVMLTDIENFNGVPPPPPSLSSSPTHAMEQQQNNHESVHHNIKPSRSSMGSENVQENHLAPPPVKYDLPPPVHQSTANTNSSQQQHSNEIQSKPPSTNDFNAASNGHGGVYYNIVPTTEMYQQVNGNANHFQSNSYNVAPTATTNHHFNGGSSGGLNNLPHQPSFVGLSNTNNTEHMKHIPSGVFYNGATLHHYDNRNLLTTGNAVNSTMHDMSIITGSLSNMMHPPYHHHHQTHHHHQNIATSQPQFVSTNTAGGVEYNKMENEVSAAVPQPSYQPSPTPPALIKHSVAVSTTTKSYHPQPLQSAGHSQQKVSNSNKTIKECPPPVTTAQTPIGGPNENNNNILKAQNFMFMSTGPGKVNRVVVH